MIILGSVAEAAPANDYFRGTRSGSTPMQSFGNSSIVNASATALEDQDWKKGVELARSALRSTLSPDEFPLANNNMCIGLTFLRESDEALAFCDKAVRGRPRQWQFYNNRAITYYYLGNYDRSLADYYMAMLFGRGQSILLENIHLTLKARKGADL
jgi:tetratricopeptide (TPR) repeat protein